MDGENNGKPYFLMDYLGVPLFLETPRWWQLKYFLFSPRTLGKMVQFDEYIFQMGWFNQPDFLLFTHEISRVYTPQNEHVPQERAILKGKWSSKEIRGY